MIIDCNNIIGRRKTKPEIKAESLLKNMDVSKIDKAVIFCFAPIMDNSSIAKAIENYPDRFIGLFTVNPWLDQSEEDLLRALDLGFSGLRLDPVRHGYKISEIDLLSPLMTICEKYQVPVWAFGAAEVFSSPILFQELAETFPKVDLIMGHMGYSYEVTSAIGVAQRNQNVYLDITGNFFANVKKVIKTVPVDQILFGSGTPEFGTFDSEIQKVRDATGNLEYRNKIFGENAARLFKI